MNLEPIFRDISIYFNTNGQEAIIVPIGVNDRLINRTAAGRCHGHFIIGPTTIVGVVKHNCYVSAALIATNVALAGSVGLEFTMTNVNRIIHSHNLIVQAWAI